MERMWRKWCVVFQIERDSSLNKWTGNIVNASGLSKLASDMTRPAPVELLLSSGGYHFSASVLQMVSSHSNARTVNPLAVCIIIILWVSIVARYDCVAVQVTIACIHILSLYARFPFADSPHWFNACVLRNTNTCVHSLEWPHITFVVILINK